MRRTKPCIVRWISTCSVLFPPHCWNVSKPTPLAIKIWLLQTLSKYDTWGLWDWLRTQHVLKLSKLPLSLLLLIQFYHKMDAQCGTFMAPQMASPPKIMPMATIWTAKTTWVTQRFQAGTNTESANVHSPNGAVCGRLGSARLRWTLYERFRVLPPENTYGKYCKIASHLHKTFKTVTRYFNVLGD